MFNFKYLLLLLFILSTNIYAQEEQHRTPQEAIDFISKVALDFKNNIQVDGSSKELSIFKMGIVDDRLYIYQKLIILENNYTNFYLTVINLPKVRLDLDKDLEHADKDKIYADRKEDIALYTYPYNELPKKFFKLNGLVEQNEYFIKKCGDKISTAYGRFDIFSFFSTLDPRFISNNYKERINKAFNFIIKYYGGGKIIPDDKSKF